MAFAIPANPMNRLREKGELLSWSAHAREINLRSILVRTVSWRRSKKPEDESGDAQSDDDSVGANDNATQQATVDHTLSLGEFSLLKMAKNSFHNSLSDESFEGEDSLTFGWSFDDLSNEESDHKPKLKNAGCSNEDDSDDDKDNVIHQPPLRATRHLERQTSRRRRKQSKGQNYSLASALDLYASFDSLDSASSHEEILNNTSDSLELGSSRHSVGRCARRRSTHNRHLHQLPRHRQQSLSTSSDPSADYPRKSVLQKRIDNNLKAQSQHSVSTTRVNPRYVVVTSDSSGSGTLKCESGLSREARSKEQLMAAKTSKHPRFIVVESGPKDEFDKGDKQYSRRGRRRRSLTGEKSHSV